MEQETREQPKQISSMMEEPTYNAETETLTITFKKGGTYSYRNFSPEDFSAFHSAPSWGKFHHSHKDLFANGVLASRESRDEDVAVAS